MFRFNVQPGTHTNEELTSNCMSYSQLVRVLYAQLCSHQDTKQSDTVLYDLNSHIATITLNRPEVKNALNQEAYNALAQSFWRAQADPEVRCVVLTGTGTCFCSGDDVRAIMVADDSTTHSQAQLKVAENSAKARHIKPMMVPAMNAIFDCDRPVICAVNGAAVGWGMDLALCCDICICSSNAWFASLFVKRGLVADVGGLWRMPKIVGASKAAEVYIKRNRTEQVTQHISTTVHRAHQHTTRLCKHTRTHTQMRARTNARTDSSHGEDGACGGGAGSGAGVHGV